MENLGNQTETTGGNTTNRMQGMEERVSITEDMIGETVALVRENVETKK